MELLRRLRASEGALAKGQETYHPYVAMVKAIAARFKQRRWRLAPQVAISIALLAILIAKANVRTFLVVLLHIDPLLAALGLGVGVITIILSAWQWQIVLKQEQIRLSLPLLTGLYFVGYAVGRAQSIRCSR